MTDTAIALIAFPASILGLALYAFIGGLVSRAWGRFVDRTVDDIAGILWPIAVPIAVIMAVTYYPIAGAYRLSQWSPKRKSALPGARVVR